MFFIQETFDHLDMAFVLKRLTVYTPYGEQQKKWIRPYKKEESEELKAELDRVQEVVRLIGRYRYQFVEIRNQFKKIKDLSGTLDRLMVGEVLSVTEMFELKVLVALMRQINERLHQLKWDIPEHVLVTRIEAIELLLDPEQSGIATFYLYDAYSERLKEIRTEIKTFEQRILTERKTIRKELESRLQMRFRPTGEITINKQNKDQIKQVEEVEELVYGSETYINITFKIKSTPSMDALEARIEDLKAQEEDEAYEVRKQLSKQLTAYTDCLAKNVAAIGNLDVLMAKGYYSIGIDGIKPELVSDGRLTIRNGRHIKVAHTLSKEGMDFTPITMELKNGVTCITGANMGGKTVTLRLVGMLSAMAQMGLYVPAEAMEFSMRDFIFISMGDAQDADMGLSTFGAEIVKISDVVERSDKDGLILIDELARGTNPKEGYAISKAIINYLKAKTSIGVITTHFDGLADDEDVLHLQVKGLSGVDFKVLFKELQISGEEGIRSLHKHMDYQLQEIHHAEEVPKDAINISRLMGLNENILEDAKEILETHF